MYFLTGAPNGSPKKNNIFKEGGPTTDPMFKKKTPTEKDTIDTVLLSLKPMKVQSTVEMNGVTGWWRKVQNLVKRIANAADRGEI